jgi:hypothetical protein
MPQTLPPGYASNKNIIDYFSDVVDTSHTPRMPPRRHYFELTLSLIERR